MKAVATTVIYYSRDDGDVYSHGKHYCHCFPMLPNGFILRVLLFMRTTRVIAVTLNLRQLLQTQGGQAAVS